MKPDRPQYLVVLRHGESEANASLSTVGDGLRYSISGSDPAVRCTARGVAQGQAAGRLLSVLFPLDRPLKRIYETKFIRVIQTVEAATSELGYQPERRVDARLHKRNYGRFWNLTRPGVQQLHPLEWKRYCQEGDLKYRPPDGGENYFDVFCRVDNFITSELAAVTGNVLIVTHLLPALCFRRRLEGWSDQSVLRHYEDGNLANGEFLLYVKGCGRRQWHLCNAPTAGAFNLHQM